MENFPAEPVCSLAVTLLSASFCSLLVPSHRLAFAWQAPVPLPPRSLPGFPRQPFLLPASVLSLHRTKGLLESMRAKLVLSCLS